MALPLWMLKDLKVQIYQKIGLAFIFSLAIVCVVLDIVRTAEALKSNQALYTILEINFVVIISCLPSYRALLNMSQPRSTKPSQYQSGSKQSVLSSWRRPSMPYFWRKPSSAGPFERMENGIPVNNSEGNVRGINADLEPGIEFKTATVSTTVCSVSSEGRDLYPLDPLEMPAYAHTGRS